MRYLKNKDTITEEGLKASDLLKRLAADFRLNLGSVEDTGYTLETIVEEDTQSNVTSTTDYLFLLAEYEVFGSRSYANSYEQNYQVQYDYYKAGNSKVANNHTSTTSAVWWWLRSPTCYGNYYFCSVNNNGNGGNFGAYYSAGVRPGFAV